MWFMHGGMYPWMWFGGVGMFALWGVVIALVIVAIVRFSRRDGSLARHNALDIAKERYARGEITKDEFEQIRKDLL